MRFLVRLRQTRPRACVAMKLIASGVTVLGGHAEVRLAVFAAGEDDHAARAQMSASAPSIGLNRHRSPPSTACNQQRPRRQPVNRQQAHQPARRASRRTPSGPSIGRPSPPISFGAKKQRSRSTTRSLQRRGGERRAALDEHRLHAAPRRARAAGAAARGVRCVPGRTSTVAPRRRSSSIVCAVAASRWRRAYRAPPRLSAPGRAAARAGGRRRSRAAGRARRAGGRSARIVGDHRFGPDHDGVVLVAQAVHEAARSLAGDPARVAACAVAMRPSSDAASFSVTSGSPRRHVSCETRRSARRRRRPRRRRSTVEPAAAQPADAVAARRAGSDRATPTTTRRTPAASDRLGARRRAPVVVARLEGDVQRRAARPRRRRRAAPRPRRAARRRGGESRARRLARRARRRRRPAGSGSCGRGRGAPAAARGA